MYFTLWRIDASTTIGTNSGAFERRGGALAILFLQGITKGNAVFYMSVLIMQIIMAGREKSRAIRLWGRELSLLEEYDT